MYKEDGSVDGVKLITILEFLVMVVVVMMMVVVIAMVVA